MHNGVEFFQNAPTLGAENDMPFLDAGDSKIFYEQIGQGPDLVWVGGGGTVGRD